MRRAWLFAVLGLVASTPVWSQAKPASKAQAVKVAHQPQVGALTGSIDSAGPTGPVDEMLAHQRELEAIRQALLQTALNSPLRVRSMSWIDGQGRLQESAQFSSDTQVRGVRVESYVNDDNAADFRVHVDASPVKLPVGVGAKPETDERACAQSNARWRQRVRVAWQWADGWQQLPEPIQKQLQMHSHAAWQQQAERPGRWLWQAQPYVGNTRYSQALLQPAMQRTESRAVLSVSVLQPQGRPVTWMDRITLSKPEQPAPVLRWRMQVQVHATQQERAFEWDMPLVYGPLSLHGGSGTGTFNGWNLPKDAAQQLRQWVQWMDTQTLCDVVAYPVQQVGGEWRVMADDQLGVRPGDRFLIVDRASVPQRMLEPGALASLAIAEVGATARESSQIRWLAGPTPQPGRDWVALPL
jgi:hypothetical protein